MRRCLIKAASFKSIAERGGIITIAAPFFDRNNRGGKPMKYNERKFNMDVAAVAGLREAVIADYIRGLQLTSDETAYRHGYFWVKCTQKTMTVHIPFLTEDMVRHSVKKLVEKGIIKVAVLDEDKFDHTYYYTFTKYGEELLDDNVCIETDEGDSAGH